MNKLCKILLLGVCCFISLEVYADGDAKTMSDHELRVKASWNCNSAKEWCKEDQSVTYNKCMCAKRMCDAADRVAEASRRGYDNGQECADGAKYCSTSHSSECKKALEGPRPSAASSGSSNSGTKSSSDSKNKTNTNTSKVSLEGSGACVAGTNGQRTCPKRTITLDIPNELLAQSFVCEKDCPAGCSNCKDYYLCLSSDSGAVSCKSHTTICSQLLLESSQNMVLRAMGSGSSKTTELISQKLAEAGCGELLCGSKSKEPVEGVAGSVVSTTSS